jgi:DNA gyrase subunit A
MNPIEKRNDIQPVCLEDELKRSYLDYAMSVIVSRALPDVRDGLKPVHRRILFAMKEAGNEYNRPYRKSARTVGDVMGKFHPHGNMAIYDAMVRLAQDFSLRVPLIDGQGNFGSMDGDPAAAERYTEARLSRAAHELLADIDKETVDFQYNYDESTLEPKVLPARFPNLLVNGCNGIAVGMATSIPTHNLGEVVDACCALIDDPELTVEALLSFIPGPDFPTGGIIIGRRGVVEAYKTGRGSFVVRGKTHIETNESSKRNTIIITEIPFQINKSRMIEKIAECVKEKIIEGISDLRDETNREGVRVVIELKKDVMPEVILNQLYRHTSLQSSFSLNMLALVHGRPVQLSLKQALQEFLEFREATIVRRTRYDLDQARQKAHILVGLSIAVAHIDEMIELIKKSPDRQTAKERILEKRWSADAILPLLKLVEVDEEQIDSHYQLSETQANGILDLRLHRLTALEQNKIADDLTELSKKIDFYLDILRDRQKILNIMRDELLEVKSQYDSPRRTMFEDDEGDLDIEDLIQPEDMVVTVSCSGYIKRVPLDTYRSQRRGGKGRSGATMRSDDIIQNVFLANTHSPVLFFTTKGKVFSLKGYKLPLGTPQSLGRAMVNLLKLDEHEKIATILVLPRRDRMFMEANEAAAIHDNVIPINSMVDVTPSEIDDDIENNDIIESVENEKSYSGVFMMFATSKGNVRRNKIEDFERINSSGKKAVDLDEGEELISVQLCSADQDVLLLTKLGQAIRFNVTAIRVFAGRSSNGVRGIRFKKSDDSVIGMSIITQGPNVQPFERDLYVKQARLLNGTLEDEDDVIDDEIDDNDDSNASNDAIPASLSMERFQEIAKCEQHIFTLTEKGLGKRVSSYAFRVTHRGGVGFINYHITPKSGDVVGSFPVLSTDDILMITDKGQMIRCPVKDVRVCGRPSKGVIVFRVDGDERIVSVSSIPASESDSMEDDSNDIQQDSFESSPSETI